MKVLLLKALGEVRSHLWLMRLMDRVWRLSIVVAGLLVATASIHYLFLPVPAFQLLIVVTVLLAVTVLWVLLERPSLELSAATGDQWFQTRELLTTGLYLVDRSDAPLAEVVESQLVEALDHVREVAKPPVISASRQAGVVISVMLACASLFVMNLDRSRADDKSLPAQLPLGSPSIGKQPAEEESTLTTDWRSLMQADTWPGADRQKSQSAAQVPGAAGSESTGSIEGNEASMRLADNPGGQNAGNAAASLRHQSGASPELLARSIETIEIERAADGAYQQAGDETQSLIATSIPRGSVTATETEAATSIQDLLYSDLMPAARRLQARFQSKEKL